jgi:phage-related protein
MKLLAISQAQYKVAAVIDEQGNKLICPVYQFFESIEKQYKGSADGLLALIERIAKNGTQGLSSKLCHLVDEENKIYELIKGDLRVFFFKGHCDLIVIATHGIIKKTQNTKASDKIRAINYKKHYQKEHDKKCIEILGELS